MDYKRNIISYYDNTQLDYRLLWFRKGNRSVHFGFHDQGTSTHDEALTNLNRAMARNAMVEDGDIILDAGCGHGESAIWLAEKYDVQVHGITLVPHQVRIAQKMVNRRKIASHVSFHEQDYTATSFEDETFSLIWACESMCHAHDKADFYREAYRLLKPGGRIICADYIRSLRPLSSEDENLLHEWLDGWSIRDLDTVHEHTKNAENEGFLDCEIEDITPFTRPSLQRLYFMANKLWGLGKVLRRVGIRNDINHGNHRGSIRQFQALERDLWFYGLISAKKK